jgi:hypothetical protein
MYKRSQYFCLFVTSAAHFIQHLDSDVDAGSFAAFEQREKNKLYKCGINFISNLFNLSCLSVDSVFLNNFYFLCQFIDKNCAIDKLT